MELIRRIRDGVTVLMVEHIVRAVLGLAGASWC